MVTTLYVIYILASLLWISLAILLGSWYLKGEISSFLKSAIVLLTGLALLASPIKYIDWLKLGIIFGYVMLVITYLFVALTAITLHLNDKFHIKWSAMIIIALTALGLIKLSLPFDVAALAALIAAVWWLNKRHFLFWPFGSLLIATLLLWDHFNGYIRDLLYSQLYFSEMSYTIIYGLILLIAMSIIMVLGFTIKPKNFISLGNIFQSEEIEK